MDAPQNPHQAARATLISFLLLALLIGGGFVFFFSLLGPFVIAFLGVLLAMLLIGCCHYLLWGRSMTNEVQNDPEANDTLNAEANGWPEDGPPRPRRF